MSAKRESRMKGGHLHMIIPELLCVSRTSPWYPLSRQQCQDDWATKTTGCASTWQYAHPDWSGSELHNKSVTEAQNSQTNDNILEAHVKFSVRFLAQSTFIFTAIPESQSTDVLNRRPAHRPYTDTSTELRLWRLRAGRESHPLFPRCQLERRQSLLFMVGVGSVKWWAQQTHTKQNLRAVPVSTAELWLVGVSHKRNYYVQKMRVKRNVDRKGGDREDRKGSASRDHWRKCQHGQSLRPKRFSAAVP